jgi:hypothetical protein
MTIGSDRNSMGAEGDVARERTTAKQRWASSPTLPLHPLRKVARLASLHLHIRQVFAAQQVNLQLFSVLSALVKVKVGRFAD